MTTSAFDSTGTRTATARAAPRTATGAPDGRATTTRNRRARTPSSTRTTAQGNRRTTAQSNRQTAVQRNQRTTAQNDRRTTAQSNRRTTAQRSGRTTAQSNRKAAAPAGARFRSTHPVADALVAAEHAVQSNSIHVELPFIGVVHLPPREELAFIGGVTGLAAVGVLEWPVALLLALGHTMATSQHNKLLRSFGQALEEA